MNNTTLWILQGILAALFALVGYKKVTNSVEKHIADGHLKAGESVVFIRVLGVLEMLGSIGIIVPQLTGILPVLTPVSAICFALVMCAAIIVHAKKKEWKLVILPIILLMFSVLVAWFRLK